MAYDIREHVPVAFVNDTVLIDIGAFYRFRQIRLDILEEGNDPLKFKYVILRYVPSAIPVHIPALVYFKQLFGAINII